MSLPHTNLHAQLSITNDNPNTKSLNEAIERWLAQASAQQLSEITAFFAPVHRATQWQQLISCSEFASQQLLRTPTQTLHILSHNFDEIWNQNHYQQALSHYIPAQPNDAQLDTQLRQWRNAMMVRSQWRDLNRLAPTLTITAELTHMADVAIACALNHHYNTLCALKGTPTNSTGQPQPFLVIGMGKLGAFELNLSSDIDLIFVYPEAGSTQHAPANTLSNQEFFTLLGQKLIKSLDTQTANGFVFRVDMRLRPYGQSGALVCNFDAFENYYLTQGRDWERYAMIKARVVATSQMQPFTQTQPHVRELMLILRNFTYRKYVDFSAIEALRDLKTRIRQEVKRRRLKDNVKLGEGGIREVEFIVQALQLIRGGRDTQLQTPSLPLALEALVALDAIPANTAQTLMQSYLFLRNAEHAIQAWQDKQTQDLPTSENAQWALCRAMGFADWASFYQQLQQHMAFVSLQFGDVIRDKTSNETYDNPANSQWQSLWAEHDPALLNTLLTTYAFDDAEQAAQVLYGLQRAPQISAVDKTGADRLNRFMPLLLRALKSRPHAGQTLARLQPFILAVARRSAYLLLLIENPAALEQLIILSEASPWIPERLAAHPALLDELLSPAHLYSIPTKNELATDLQQTMLRIPEDDLEQQMDALRYFRQAHSLKVAACEVTSKLPLMKVSDYLTELAEVLLQHMHLLPNILIQPNRSLNLYKQVTIPWLELPI